jgi:hypothetical protein
MLLEERTLPHQERRQRGMQRIPSAVRMAALEKAWKNRHWWEKPTRSVCA